MSFWSSRQGDSTSVSRLDSGSREEKIHDRKPGPGEFSTILSTEVTTVSLAADTAMSEASHLKTQSDIFNDDRKCAGADQYVRPFQSAQMASADRANGYSSDTSQADHSSLYQLLSTTKDSSSPRCLKDSRATSVKDASSRTSSQYVHQAVTSPFHDLQQKQNILVIADDSANEEAPFYLTSNMGRFFMTEQQSQDFSHSDPETWPQIPHSDALRQNHHAHLETASKVSPDELVPALLVGTTGEKVPLFDLTYFFGNLLPFCQGVYSKDFTPAGPQLPPVLRKDTYKDNKIVAMLKFVVKYTDEDINAAWISQFLSQPLPEEVKQLRTLYDTLKLSKKMERHWSSLQKQRYNGKFRWLHHLNPVNAEMWALKQLYKLREPNKYLRKKSMWRTVCYGAVRQANILIIPDGDQQFCPEPTHSHIEYQNPADTTTWSQQPASTNDHLQHMGDTASAAATPTNLDEAFSEWVKNSGANLTVTISYAWNELIEDGVLYTQFPEPHQIDLISALNDLEATINSYGTDDQSNTHNGAVVYAGVILRFTQALHDYLEVKDYNVLMHGALSGWSVERESCYKDLLIEPGDVEENGCACYKCRVAWSDGGEACTCAYCTSKDVPETAVPVEEVAVPANAAVTYANDAIPEMRYEHTKRMLQYLDQVVNGDCKPNGLGIVNENATILPEETRVRLIRSVRLRSYEKQKTKNRPSEGHDSDVSQTESMLSSRDCSPDPTDRSSPFLSAVFRLDGKMQF